MYSPLLLRKRKEADLQNAVDYCKQLNVCGYAAISANICPLIKDARTINRVLDDVAMSKCSKRSDCKILNDVEEKALIQFLKNRSRSLQGINRKETTLFIHDMLKVRDHLNKRKKGGRLYQPISVNGKKFLDKRKLSKSFLHRFEIDFPSLSRKMQGNATTKRVLACEEMVL